VEIVRKLREAGHVAYLAGGCVRDTLLGGLPKDFDVATDAPPEVVQRIFPGGRAVGEAFGVILVKTGRGRPFRGDHFRGRHFRGRHFRGGAVFTEVATFREEWGYSDGRRPDGVRFTDARHDAQRRDFTINGLFADPFGDVASLDPPAGAGGRSETGGRSGAGGRLKKVEGLGVVIDYVGGLDDLEAKVVRAIGDADARFAEDYLRMLRAARFAARLGFTLESKTAAAIRPLAKYLGQVSRERIGAEVLMMMVHPTRAVAADLIQQLRLDAPALNEDHAEPPLPTLAALPADASAPVALAAWLLDRHARPPTPGGALTPAAAAAFIAQHGKRVVSRWRGALCLSNEDRDALARTLRLLAAAAQWDALGVARRKRLLADEGWGDAALVLAAIDAGFAQDVAKDAAALAEDGIGLAPPALLGGDDLIALGLRPSPAFKRLLDGVYDAQLEGAVRDRDAAVRWVGRAAGRADLYNPPPHG